MAHVVALERYHHARIPHWVIKGTQVLCSAFTVDLLQASLNPPYYIVRNLSPGARFAEASGINFRQFINDTQQQQQHRQTPSSPQTHRQLVPYKCSLDWASPKRHRFSIMPGAPSCRVVLTAAPNEIS